MGGMPTISHRLATKIKYFKWVVTTAISITLILKAMSPQKSTKPSDVITKNSNGKKLLYIHLFFEFGTFPTVSVAVFLTC